MGNSNSRRSSKRDPHHGADVPPPPMRQPDPYVGHPEPVALPVPPTGYPPPQIGSVATPPPQVPPPEPIRGIYSHYKWNLDQVSVAIRIGRLSPLGGAQTEPGPGVPVFCEICYQYYPAVNATSCCHRQICTECVAASLPPPPQSPPCPFCRRPDVHLTANVVSGASEQDDEEFVRYNERVRAGLADRHIDEFETEIAPEVNADIQELATRFNVPSRDLRELYAAGLTRDEIIIQLLAGVMH